MSVPNRPVVVTLLPEITEKLESSACELPSYLAYSQESEADPFRTPLPAVKYKGIEIEAVTIKFTRKHKVVTLARYLCGKIIFQPERVTREELLIMYYNFLGIQDIAEKNENFVRKFGQDLESLAKILKSFRISSKTSELDLRKLGSKMKQELTNFYLPERNLSTVEKSIAQMWYLTPPRPAGIPKNRLPPKAYIGKGYTDKGTARDTAIDGSPAWQEIASHFVEDREP